MKTKPFLAAMALSLVGLAAQAQTDVSVSVGGIIQPGVYGRVEIGTRPPPPVYYPQPVVIVPQPVAVVQQPIYMHVPPGHAKKWSKHCYKYNACNQPVYFVRADYDRDDDDRGHRGKGHGRGGKHGKNKHDD
jgi:hypothetical protein